MDIQNQAPGQQKIGTDGHLNGLLIYLTAFRYAL